MFAEYLGNKLPGKTQFSGRRRTTTRTSGFKSHPDSTGGELKIEEVESILIPKGESILITFQIPDHNSGDIVAFGGWYSCNDKIKVEVLKGGFSKELHTQPEDNNWSKFGSMATSNTYTNVAETQVRFTAIENEYLALYEVGCGVVEHRHLEWAKVEKPVLLKNMYQFAPESNFYSIEGDVSIELSFDLNKTSSTYIYLKSCNRCARFLPININNERHHLSFSNHCVAEHRRPCSHGGFGRLKNIETDQTIQLEYGYQLECRFCKKYEVNAAHNPQRTAAQMKEDGARRRSFELLLTAIFDKSPQLMYREKFNGRELTDDIWLKFGKKCFNCSTELESPNDMNLDHTRPLALLWPLDETATCLCGSCNSQKRDRAPSEFYSPEKLVDLSKITGLSLNELQSPSPNLNAVEYLIANLDWLFNSFCQRPELQKIRDGKLTSDLLLKALQKILNKTEVGKKIDLLKRYRGRN